MKFPPLAAALCGLLLLSVTPAPGFTVEQIASIPGARELAFAPDGTLFAGTSADSVEIVAGPESASPSIGIFATPGDAPAAGVAFANGSLIVGTQHAVWRIPYRHGDHRASGEPVAIAHLRTGDAPAGSDGDVHTTTSVAADASHVYASVGSSCNACVESDPTRATVGLIAGGRYRPMARRIRNAIGLAIDPQTGTLWASDAGQDELPIPHPYEFLDGMNASGAPADYGWPFCYEDGKRKPGYTGSCKAVRVPRIIFPAYETPIGATFYPAAQRGRYAFPQRYRGGMFVTLHGSWHGPSQGLPDYLPPRVVFVPMRSGQPAIAPNWSDPAKQWTAFITYEQNGRERSGRPTGIAVGPQGDLFVADDLAGAIYRVRPR